MHKLEPKPFL